MVSDADIETWTLDDGTKLSLRHIAPGDANKEQSFIRKLSTQSRYFRFHGYIRELSPSELEESTHPDPCDMETLIVLYGSGKNEEEVAAASFVVDPDNVSCEFAIAIADEWQKHGLGERLMQALIKHAQSRGIKRIYGSVMKDNAGMRQFTKGLGFTEIPDHEDDSVVLVTKNL